MADFLARLAERTLGLIPVAQPLLAPTFAPGPALSGEIAHILYEETSSGDAESIGNAFSQETVPSSTRPATPTSAGNAEMLSPGNIARPTNRDQFISPTIGETDRPADGVNRSLVGDGRSEDKPNPENERERRAVIHEVKGVTQSYRFPEGPAQSYREAEVPSQLRHPGERQSNSVAPAVPTRSTDRLVEQRVANDDLTDTLPSAQRLPLPTREKSAPAPTIRVTIGRVEVRAILPPKEAATHAPPARPKPRLSLDDYLKQQNGGQR